MTRSNDRTQRVADAIKRIVAEAIHHEVKDFDLTMVTVTRCDLARDFSEATIRYSVLGDEAARKDCREKLGKVATFLQRRIAESIKIHHVPHLKFEFDASIEESLKLEQLFDQINRERRQAE
ncbi:MAG TPA: 30S ribosome-binding factor RbfA [bacterium]|nr:30S ribosome-binding factor RbfA [bacterium]